ncbi:hypothetical protein GCM10020331_036490 [Ectobacillus funiculus]
MSYWKKRFEEADVVHEEIKERAGRSTLAFKDFEGQRLILVSDEANKGVAGGIPWEKEPYSAQLWHSWLGTCSINRAPS